MERKLANRRCQYTTLTRRRTLRWAGDARVTELCRVIAIGAHGNARSVAPEIACQSRTRCAFVRGELTRPERLDRPSRTLTSAWNGGHRRGAGGAEDPRGGRHPRWATPLRPNSSRARRRCSRVWRERSASIPMTTSGEPEGGIGRRVRPDFNSARALCCAASPCPPVTFSRRSVPSTRRLGSYHDAGLSSSTSSPRR